MTDALMKKIKQLPPLPESAMQIETVYQDPDSTFNDMVTILEKDPLLTADILKAANSPLYGFSREINAISQAVGLFGMGTVRGFALASIVKKSFSLNLQPYGISNAQFSKLSQLQHALVTAWYLRKDPKLAGTLSPAAFLVEIGKVLIAQYLISENRAGELKAKIAETDTVEAAERAICDCDTPEVSANIFEHWRFEPALIDTIRYASTPEKAPAENATAAKVLHVVRTAIPIDGVITAESEAASKALVEEYALERAGFTKALNAIKEG